MSEQSSLFNRSAFGTYTARDQPSGPSAGEDSPGTAPGASGRAVGRIVAAVREAAPAARSRVSDDLTSHEAAARMNDSGKAQYNHELVLAEIRRKPGQTAAEVGEATGLGHHEAQRRLSDACKAGLVRKGEARPCTMKGSRMTTWHPSEGGRP